MSLPVVSRAFQPPLPAASSTRRSKAPLLRVLLRALLLASGFLAACEEAPVSPRTDARPPAAVARTIQVPVTPDVFGINVSQLRDVGAAGADSVKNAGITWVRADFSWTAIQPSSASDWDVTTTGIDQTVTLANDSTRHLKILGVLGYTPGWANGNAGFQAPPTDTLAWKEYVRRVVTQYRGKVHAWSVWNEPCTPNFWTGSDADYDRIFRMAAKTIRANDSTAQIVLGELPYGDGACASRTDLDQETEQAQWLATRLNNASATATPVDVIAVHMYGLSSDLTNAMVRLHTRLQTAGWGPVPVWLTETAKYGGLHNTDQADHLLEMYRGMGQNSSWWKKTFYFHFFSHDTINNDFGIVAGTSLVPYDAYRTYRLMANGCGSYFGPANANCVAMYRWWRTADHMFGPDPSEGYGAGYLSEGVGFRLAAHAYTTHLIGLYRCVSGSTGQHLLTTTTNCDGLSGWTKDNGGNPYGYVVAPDSYVTGSSMLPLYRLRYPGNGEHLYTIDVDEKNTLVSGGWVLETSPGYAWQ
jgi:hypothetical protein